MPCKSATVPAAVSSPRERFCLKTIVGLGADEKVADKSKSEDLPEQIVNCKPSGPRAAISVAIITMSFPRFVLRSLIS